MDKKNLTFLNKFAKDMPQAIDIDVKVLTNGLEMKPKPGCIAKWEDGELIHSLIRGAESFIYFLEDNNYEIRRKK